MRYSITGTNRDMLCDRNAQHSHNRVPGQNGRNVNECEINTVIFSENKRNVECMEIFNLQSGASKTNCIRVIKLLIM